VNFEELEEGSLATRCGTVHEGSLHAVINQSSGRPVTVEEAVSEELVIVRDLESSQDILVALLGVGPSKNGSSTAAKSLINSFSGVLSYLFVPAEGCEIDLAGGGRATVGQIVSASGYSVTETLLAAGLASGDYSAVCGADLLSSCLNSLENSQPISAGPLSAFLWKPFSDSDGNLAIHTGPYNTIVVVNGEQGRNQGPGNGYGSLARFSRNGCGYASPRIEVRDGRSGLAYTVNGRTSFTVPDPCSRYCLRDGNIVACPK